MKNRGGRPRKANAHTTVLAMKVSAPEYDAAYACAIAHELSLSELARLALLAFIHPTAVRARAAARSFG